MREIRVGFLEIVDTKGCSFEAEDNGIRVIVKTVFIFF